jgi:hypothetical protein
MPPLSIHVQSAKEVVRHLAFSLGAAGFLDRRRARAGLGTVHLTEATARDRFTSIYRNGIWRMTEGQASLSGTGSELAATAGVREGRGCWRIWVAARWWTWAAATGPGCGTCRWTATTSGSTSCPR